MYGVILCIVGVVYFYRTYRGAMKQVVRLVGATPANRQSHRRLYLTVENLSISLGIRSPTIYVINDPAMNAFAAGHRVDNSIIGVTSGLLENLDRQELEGVIAHELSHIVNRDVRLATIAYALVAALGIIIEINFRSGMGSSRRNNGWVILLLSLLIGVLLLLLAFLVKMALSRRREYLADVTGAQITKYPDGLAAALEKIKSRGSKLNSRGNGALAHLFFANPVKRNFLANLLNTHPPLEQRIARLRQLNLSGL